MKAELLKTNAGWFIEIQGKDTPTATVRLPDNFYAATLALYEMIGSLGEIMGVIADYAKAELDETKGAVAKLRLISTDDRPVCPKCEGIHDRHDPCSVLDADDSGTP